MTDSNPQEAMDGEVTIRVVSEGLAPVPELDDAAPDNGSAPAAAPSGAASAELFTVPTVAKSVEGVYSVIAERRGEHWIVSPAEALTIAEPLTGELNDLAQTFPGYSRVAGTLGGRRMQLLSALALVNGPRLVVDVRVSAQRQREARSVELDRRMPGTVERAAPSAGEGLAAILADTPPPGSA